ncbi:Mucin-22 [Fusarium oxysporum f. sp. albedinis]|nr:Mucin-22 [Fusarium oxysporum f. sp. albedinis]
MQVLLINSKFSFQQELHISNSSYFVSLAIPSHLQCCQANMPARPRPPQPCPKPDPPPPQPSRTTSFGRLGKC